MLCGSRSCKDPRLDQLRADQRATVQLSGQPHAVGATSLLQAAVGTMVQLLSTDLPHSRS